MDAQLITQNRKKRPAVSPIWSRIVIAGAIIALPLCALVVIRDAFAEESAPASDNQPTTQESTAGGLTPEQLIAQNEELRTKLAAISADRENILSQIKIAYKERDKVYDMAGLAYQERDAVLQMMEDLPEQVELLKSERKIIEDKLEEFKTTNSGLDTEKTALTEEIEKLKSSLKKTEESFSKDERNAKILLATDQIRDLKSKLTLATDRKTDLEKESKDRQIEMEKLHQQMQDLDSIKAENNRLKERLMTIPGDLAKITKEKERSIKDAADMHYNMGVFFAKNKQFDRALKEFEKSIQFKPDDSMSHYNLGIIYSEHMHDEEKAILHFERYVEINPDANDADWVMNTVGTLKAFRGRSHMR